ncbi:MAG: Hsp33 family molecular chaperone HslO [Bacillota bacterium]
MDRIIKSVIFGGQARVAVLLTTEATNKATEQHGLTPLSAAILGRSITAGAYISNNLKGKKDKFNLIIDGGGISGKVYVAGFGGNVIKGYIEHPSIDLPYKNNKLDVGGAVGTDGAMVVVKDLGLKEPYIGRCELVSGEIAEDFATYLLKSEGIASAVALGVLVDEHGCSASGGVIIEAMPGADENVIFMLEDIMTNFTNISSVLKEKTPEEIMSFYFEHLDCQTFPAEEIIYRCDCDTRVANIVRGLGRAEADAIVSEQGSIEIKCDYCNKVYNYGAEDLDNLFN